MPGQGQDEVTARPWKRDAQTWAGFSVNPLAHDLGFLSCDTGLKEASFEDR